MTALAQALLAISLAGGGLAKANDMDENRQFLTHAREHLLEFQQSHAPELVSDAFAALQNVFLDREPDLDARPALRAELLAAWLQLIDQIDRNLDPKFDPGDLPVLNVQPPETSDGTLYPPGADPELIDDPKKRAEYEKEIAANNAKIVHYQEQSKLRRVNTRATVLVERFLRASYTSDIEDRQLLRTAFDKDLHDAKRKAELRKILPTLPPAPR